MSYGELGGGESLVLAIPQINAEGNLLLSDTYMILVVELESVGLVYACLEETGATSPISQ